VAGNFPTSERATTATQEREVSAKTPEGKTIDFVARVRIDTPKERDYYVTAEHLCSRCPPLRQLAGSAPQPE